MKRLEWAKQVLDETENGFLDVIWTEECTVRFETHGASAVTKKDWDLRTSQGNKNYFNNLYNAYCICVLHRAKHPVKVHVWAGISTKGSTGICIFSGILKAPLYVQILEQTLLPFLHDVFANGQDNDP